MNDLVRLVITFAIGVMLGVALPYGGSATEPITPTEQGSSRTSEEVHAVTMIDLGDRVVACPERSSENEPTALALLKQCTERRDLAFATDDYGDMGVLVTRIGDKENGANDRYWQYWVNGSYAKVGSQDRTIDDGDVILWNFITPQREQ